MDINDKFMNIFNDIGLQDPGVDAVSIYVYWGGGYRDEITAYNDGNEVTIQYVLDGGPERYDGDSVSDDERNEA